MLAGELRDLLIELQSKFPDLNIPSTELLKIDLLERERISNGSTLTFTDFLNLLTSVGPSKGKTTSFTNTPDTSLQGKIDSQYEELRRLRDELSSTQEISDDCRIECGQLQLEIKRCRKELSIEQKSNAQRASMIHKMEEEINSFKSNRKMNATQQADNASSTCLPAHRSLYKLELLAKNLSLANKNLSNDRNQLYQQLFSILQNGKTNSSLIKTLIDCQKRISSLDDVSIDGFAPGATTLAKPTSKTASKTSSANEKWKYLFIFLLGMFASALTILLLLYGTLSTTLISLKSKQIFDITNSSSSFNPIF